MCLELTNKLTYAKTVTAAELEKLLADLDVDVLADHHRAVLDPG